MQDQYRPVREHRDREYQTANCGAREKQCTQKRLSHHSPPDTPACTTVQTQNDAARMAMHSQIQHPQEIANTDGWMYAWINGWESLTRYPGYVLATCDTNYF